MAGVVVTVNTVINAIRAAAAESLAAAEQKQRERKLSYLPPHRASFTAAEIAQRLTYPVAKVRDAMKAGAAEGRLERNQYGQYRVVERDEAERRERERQERLALRRRVLRVLMSRGMSYGDAAAYCENDSRWFPVVLVLNAGARFVENEGWDCWEIPGGDAGVFDPTHLLRNPHDLRNDTPVMLTADGWLLTQDDWLHARRGDWRLVDGQVNMRGFRAEGWSVLPLPSPADAEGV